MRGLRGRILYLDATTSPGRGLILYRIDGLHIVDADTGKEYGTLTEVSPTGANDVYHRHRTGRVVIPPFPGDSWADIDRVMKYVRLKGCLMMRLT